MLLSILPTLIVLTVYNKLPAQVPMQWGVDGNVVRYDDKYKLFFVAGLNILIGILMPILPKIDPKKQNYVRFETTYTTMRILLMLFMVVMIGISLVESLYPNTIVVGKVICAMIGVLFVLMGNQMPKIKSNFFMGIKTPWVLSDECVWNKTQRLGGRMFVACGLLMVIGCFVIAKQMLLFWLCMAMVVLMCGVPTVMSYIWYQKIQHTQQ